MNTEPCSEELDAAILAALRTTDDECGWWSELRERLPASTYWAKVESLTRLIEAGQVHHTKIGGRNFVCLAISARAA